jgi:hypothetical protein
MYEKIEAVQRDLSGVGYGVTNFQSVNSNIYGEKSRIYNEGTKTGDMTHAQSQCDCSYL